MTPKTLIAISVLLLAIAGVFGFLNTQKARALRTELVNVTSARDDMERRRSAEQKQLKEREAAVAAASAKTTENDNRVAKAEADLVQLQSERADLQSKLQAAQSEVSTLQSQVQEAGAKPSDNPGAASLPELQAQLDDARKQLESAEHENAFYRRRSGRRRIIRPSCKTSGNGGSRPLVRPAFGERSWQSIRPTTSWC